jgi:hypothetical protein
MTETSKWEYQVQTVGSALSGPKDEDLEALLDEWGAEGWEVITVAPIENSNRVRIVGKRQLAGAPRRPRTWPG